MASGMASSSDRLKPAACSAKSEKGLIVKTAGPAVVEICF
jgi:hypothetical protein